MKNNTSKIFKRALFAFIILHSTLIISAQQTNLDSLYSVWEDKSQTDSTRLKAIGDIARKGYLFSQPDSAFYYAQLQYNFAKSKGLKQQMANALNTLGISFAIRGGYPQALNYYQRSLKVYEEIGNKKGIASSLNNIGNIYKKQGDYPQALNYYQKSLKITEEIRDKKGIAGALNNIGVIYVDQGDYLQALNYYQRSLKVDEEIGGKRGIAQTLNNIGIIYAEQGDYPQALNYYQRSLRITEEYGNKSGIANTLNSIGRIYAKQGENKLAIGQCQQALTLSEEIGAVAEQKQACHCLYNAYKALGNGNKALAYHEQMLVLEDSLNTEETAKKLQQMEFAKQVLKDSIAQAETDRLVLVAHQVEIQAEEKTRNIAFGVGVLVLLLAGGLYGRLRYVRKSKAIIEEEKDRSNNLLLNILPADIAEELKIHGKAQARDFDMVSILFTDFKGFTEASAKLSASDLVAEINTCFEAFDLIMEKYKIEKIKTIGDSYMAAGGLPVPTTHSVKNTVLAALEIQNFVIQRKIENDAQNKPAFQMRVGINTGPVVAGIVGVKKFQYDVWGDTVNTASRMESNGEIRKVNISKTTYELLKDDADFSFESRGKIKAKGKGEIEMWFVDLTQNKQ
jgi:class 3 adenylate cyclase/Tfp pilus assembly protein PilF